VATVYGDGHDNIQADFADRVAYLAMRFAGLVDLPADYQADFRRILAGLVYAQGSEADGERLDFIVPLDLAGPTQDVRADLNRAVRLVWAGRRWEERYGKGRVAP